MHYSTRSILTKINGSQWVGDSKQVTLGLWLLDKSYLLGCADLSVVLEIPRYNLFREGTYIIVIK